MIVMMMIMMTLMRVIIHAVESFSQRPTESTFFSYGRNQNCILSFSHTETTLKLIYSYG